MDGVALKTALLRAEMGQEELARRLGRERGMVARWIRQNRVPPEWEPLVLEALGQSRPMGAFTDDELLDELRARLIRSRLDNDDESRAAARGRYMGSGGKRA